LLVGDFFEPVDDFGVELFLGGDVGHGGGGRGTVPMLLARGEPDDVAGPDFLDRSALALRPAATGEDDQGLAQRMRVPRGPGAGFEGNRGSRGAARVVGLEQGIDAHRAGEPVVGSFHGGLGAVSCDFHKGANIGHGGTAVARGFAGERQDRIWEEKD
jgi:hypothetical protein